MDGFSVGALFSLTDLVSGPLTRIQARLRLTEDSVGGLSSQMGNLASAMTPVVIAAGLLISVLGLTAREAIAFESAMADVAKVVNFESAEAMQAMSDEILDMSARIPMAKEGLAAIIAAAAQSGVAKEDLKGFAEQAAKMGVAFDLSGDQAGKMMADWRAGMGLSLPRVYALADSVNHLSNNMNATAPALGEVIQRAGAVGMAAGLTETQVAALGAAFLSAGSSPEIASTAMTKFTTTLVKGAAMSKDAQAAFSSLGFSATQMAKDMQTDAQGTIFKVLQALADKPKELQMSLLTEMFGEEAIRAIAPLLANMDNLSQSFNLVGDASAYAGSMQAEFDARSKTTENALTLMGNRFKALLVVVGSYFLPVIAGAADALGLVADMLRAVARSAVGEFAIKMVAGVAAAALVVAALAAGSWALSAAMPFLAASLTPLAAAVAAVSWPVWLLAAAVAALYVVWRTNIGGMRDWLTAFWARATLVVEGVIAVFKSLNGSVGEVKGKLAEDLEAAGLVGLVTTVGKIVYRIKEFFAGLWTGISAQLAPIGAMFAPILESLVGYFSALWRVVSGVAEALGLAGAATNAGTWSSFGEVVGTVVGGAFRLMAFALSMLLEPLRLLLDGLASLINYFSQFGSMGDMAAGVASSITSAFSGLNLFGSGAAIMDTLWQGIKSKGQALYEGVAGVFSQVRNLLPFSDAREGPLSQLTLSGSRILSTMGEGLKAAAPGLMATAEAALTGVGELLALPSAEAGEAGAAAAQRGGSAPAGGKRQIIIQSLHVALPGVSDAEGFVGSLQRLVEEFDADGDAYAS